MSRYDEMLLDKIMEHFPGPVRLTQPRGFAITMIVGGFVVILPCLLLAYPGLLDVVDRFPRRSQVFGGLTGVACGLYAIAHGALYLRRQHTAVLDGEGFRTASSKGSSWFPWKQVDHFKVVSRGDEGSEVDFLLPSHYGAP